MKNEEIDLIELIIKIYKFIKKYIIIFVIALIIGVIIGFIKNKSGSTTYKSSILVTSGFNNELFQTSDVFKFNNLLTDLTLFLNNQLQSGDLEILATKMNLTVDELSCISSISIAATEELEKQKNSFSQNFEITVVADNSDIFAKLGEGLKNYFTNNEYFKTLIEQQKIYSEQLIKKLDEEIYEIDSLQKTKKNSNMNVTIYENEYTNSSKIIELYKTKIKTEKNLQLSETIFIIENFYNPVSISSASKTNLIIFPVILLFLAFMFAIIREINILSKR